MLLIKVSWRQAPPEVVANRVTARPQGAVTHPHCRVAPARTPRTAERRAAPHPQRAAHLFAPALCKTRRSPAGPKHRHLREQAAAGRESIHGAANAGEGRDFFHVPTPTSQRA